MFIGIRALGLLSILTAASCTSLPALQDEDHLSLSNIVKGVECELITSAKELYEKHPSLDFYGVAIKLTIIADDFNEIAPGLSTITPIARPASIVLGTVTSLVGTVSVDAKADLTGQSRRTVALELGYKFSNLRKFACERVYVGKNPLESNLGIYEALARPLDASSIGQPIRVGTTIQFVVTKEGRVTPGISLVRLNGPSNIGPNSLFLGRRTDDHTLDVSVSPLPKS